MAGQFIGVIGGPVIEFRWAGLNLNPKEDGATEYRTSNRDYEIKSSGNSNIYATSTAMVGYFQTECVFSPADFNALMAFHDGIPRSGDVTMADGTTLLINGALDGEMKIVDGESTIKISGDVRVQLQGG